MLEFQVIDPCFKYVLEDDQYYRHVYLCCMNTTCQCTAEEKDDNDGHTYMISVTDRVVVRYERGKTMAYDLINQKNMDVNDSNNDGHCLNSVVAYEGSMLTVRHLLKL